jgi:hypothetical protein
MKMMRPCGREAAAQPLALLLLSSTSRGAPELRSGLIGQIDLNRTNGGDNPNPCCDGASIHDTLDQVLIASVAFITDTLRPAGRGGLSLNGLECWRSAKDSNF